MLLYSLFLVFSGLRCGFSWCAEWLPLKIAPELKPYLLELGNNFLKYNITNILPLRSAFIIRLYELCKDHYSEGTRYRDSVTSVTFDIKVDKLRELFEIPNSYQYSSHIKTRIIDKAVKQLKDKTDIQIVYKEQKIGRKVDRLLITVKDNNKGSNDYLSSQKAFISYLRANCVNVDLYKGKDKNTLNDMILSIAPDGKIYDKKSSNDFNAKRSSEMWEALYNLAKQGIISIKEL